MMVDLPAAMLPKKSNGITFEFEQSSSNVPSINIVLIKFKERICNNENVILFFIKIKTSITKKRKRILFKSFQII